MNDNSLKFEVGVDVGEGGVDGSKGDGVVDEEGEATTRPITRPIATNKSVVRKDWIFSSRSQLRFLQASDEYIVLDQEMT